MMNMLRIEIAIKIQRMSLITEAQEERVARFMETKYCKQPKAIKSY